MEGREQKSNNATENRRGVINCSSQQADNPIKCGESYKIRTAVSAVVRLIHQKLEAVINICGEGESPQNKENLFL